MNPIINAVVQDRFQQALKEAKNVDDYLTKCALSEEDLEKIKPLLGVPVTIKESCSLRGNNFYACWNAGMSKLVLISVTFRLLVYTKV